mgnify:CR=1 FL=1
MSHSRFDVLLNALLAVACLAVTAASVKRLVAEPQQASPQAGYAIGDVLPSIPGVNYGDREQTLVMFLSSNCRYCTESAPFYSALTARRDAASVRIVAVGTEPQEALSSYLEDHSVRTDNVVTVTPGTFRVRGTPTLVLVNRKGEVHALWRGALRGREGEVEAAVLGPQDVRVER